MRNVRASAMFAVPVLLALLTTQGCGGQSSESAIAVDGAGAAPGSISVPDDAAVTRNGVNYYLPAYENSARAVGSRASRAEAASTSLQIWRDRQHKPEASSKDLSESFGVDEQELDNFLRDAGDTLDSQGLRPPDLQDLSLVDSSFYTEEAVVCDRPAAVALYPVVDGDVVATSQYKDIRRAAETPLASGVSDAWTAELPADVSVVVFLTTEVPEASVTVAVAGGNCDVADVLDQVSIERIR